MTDLGTARGRVVIDPSGAVRGYGIARKADKEYHDQVQRNASRTQAAGKALAGTGAVIAAGFAVAINSAANFEERISAIGAVSNASQKDLEKIRKKALQLGADTKFSASEAASAMEELVKAGVPLADVMTGAADATVNLAAAGGTDLVTAAEIAANALNVFNLEGKDMARVADLIAGAANSSAIDVEDYGLAMKQAGAAAALAGFDIDDLSVAITAMGNAGIKGSDAGTSLKTFLLNLQPTTIKQTKLFKQLGIITEEGANQFFDASGKVKSLADIAGVLEGALSGMTDQQRLATLETLFGSDAIRAAAIISEEGAAGMRSLADEMGRVSAQDVAEKRMDNLKGSIEQLKGSLETMSIVIGTPFLKNLRMLADAMTALVNKFGELSPKTQEWIVRGVAMFGTIATVVGGILLLAGKFAALATVLGLSAATLAGLIAVAGLVIAAIAALVVGIVLLYKNNETFREGVQRAWEWIRTNVLKAIGAVVEGVKAFGSALRGEGVTSDGFVGVMERLGVAVRAAAEWFNNVIIPALQSFAAWITGTAVPAVVRFAGAVQDVLGAAFGWLQQNVFPIFIEFQALVSAVVSKIAATIQILMPAFQAVFNFIRATITTQLNAARTIISNFASAAIQIWNLLGDDLMNAVMIVFNFLKSFIEGSLRIIRGIIQVITSIISGDWGSAWTGIRNILGGAWDQMKAIITLAINTIMLAIRAFLDVLNAVWVVAWTLVKTTIDVVWNGITTAVGAYIGALKGTIETGLNAISAIWNFIWGGMRSALSSIWDGIASAVRSGVNAVIDVINWFIRLINNIPGVDINEIAHVGAPANRGPGARRNAVASRTERRASGGFITNGPQYLVGEGNRNHPEAVIATDPKYKKRNIAYWMWAGRELGVLGNGGVVGYQLGGIVGGIGDLVGGAANLVGGFLQNIRRATLRPLFETAKGMINALPIPGGWGEQIKGFAKAMLERIYSWAGGRADEDARRRDLAASDTAGGGGSARGLVGFAQQAFHVFRRMFPNMTIGGWRARGSVPGSDHPKGKALDLMTRNQAVAQQIIRTFMGMPGRKYWIWNRQIAEASRGWVPRAYRGPSPHTDHVHLSFLRQGAWEILKDQMAMLHRGEMVVPNYNGMADMLRNMDGRGANQDNHIERMEVNIIVKSPDEARKAYRQILADRRVLMDARIP